MGSLSPWTPTPQRRIIMKGETLHTGMDYSDPANTEIENNEILREVTL
jgi:hypothetical protein